ncbi:MAG: pyridoxal-phosphate dependent enzyme [Caulobacteraceae bacterium]|nr:pyridoxal-phosphate dependent enzyme [Caulobacteraceae bacterium]
MLTLPTAAEVDAARARIAPYALRTPLVGLDGVPGVYLKLENLQPLGSFKIRPAINAMLSLGADRLARGVVTSSAGNFGQGLALAARELGVAATVVVPETSAATKTAALKALGARVVRVPFDDWWTVMTARRFEDADGVFIHPVAEQAVVAGNATIGAEILEDLPEVDAIIVPFGGGGLISGIGSVMRRERPGVRMIAIESQASQPAAAALAAGRPVKVTHDQSFVDGMGSTTVLDEMWPLVRRCVDEAACASFAQITEAIRLLAGRHHVIAEGAGAAPVAAALAGVGQGRIVCVISGGNIDPPKLGAILNGENPF